MVEKERQDVEYKESWKDEYLKWVCGFSNSQGGRIYIGINDNGDVVGVHNSRKLLEDIPNKVRDTLGIIVDVNLLQRDNKEYIEIVIHPSTYPVNYKGEYHYRSGSTKQHLIGNALTEFLLSKTGNKWDAVPVDNVSVEDLDKESFDIFRREAVRSSRMTKEDLKMSNEELLDSLGLLDGGKLKRAAVLLFHRNPEKWITGAYIKIGKFGEGSDLQYQDEIRGSLILQADRVVELIYLKYLKASISYDKEVRVETYPFPRDGIREAIFNSIIHKLYPEQIPIQIRIEEDAMYISNGCTFPTGWTKETLMERHRSIQYNPNIANTFFRAGYVETWGRGIEKICEACKQNGNPDPEYIIHPQDIMVKVTALKQSFENKDGALDGALDGVLDGALENEIVQLLIMNKKLTQNEIAKQLEVSRRTLQRAMKNLTSAGIIERVGGSRNGYWDVKIK